MSFKGQIINTSENKGIVFKARLACMAWYKHRYDHYLSGMLVDYQAVQTRRALKTIPLFSFLDTFKNKCKLWPNKAVTFNMKIKPCILMDLSGARCLHVKHSKNAVSIGHHGMTSHLICMALTTNHNQLHIYDYTKIQRPWQVYIAQNICPRDSSTCSV